MPFPSKSWLLEVLIAFSALAMTMLWLQEEEVLTPMSLWTAMARSVLEW